MSSFSSLNSNKNKKSARDDDSDDLFDFSTPKAGSKADADRPPPAGPATKKKLSWKRKTPPPPAAEPESSDEKANPKRFRVNDIDADENPSLWKYMQRHSKETAAKIHEAIMGDASGDDDDDEEFKLYIPPLPTATLPSKPAASIMVSPMKTRPLKDGNLDVAMLWKQEVTPAITTAVCALRLRFVQENRNKLAHPHTKVKHMFAAFTQLLATLTTLQSVVHFGNFYDFTSFLDEYSMITECNFVSQIENPEGLTDGYMASWFGDDAEFKRLLQVVDGLAKLCTLDLVMRTNRDAGATHNANIAMLALFRIMRLCVTIVSA